MEAATEMSQDAEVLTDVLDKVNHILESIAAKSLYINTRDRYVCPVCKKSFGRDKSYKAHYLRRHQENQRDYQCTRGDLCIHRIKHQETFHSASVDSIGNHGAQDKCNYKFKRSR